ncbi:amino acid ABC transporter permease [Rhodopila sp.]|jgi:general L-amino acid transport system permease protein|uniref:amino acid ABC transporter permease n=1 Tax=Rhodopila sp. TaxID=2480087 RepID=UPI002BD82520|nr:amino acid ABC transporter permease [Rhodopila sp.]HVZ08020.1 amino acid ABC transporter permease [Rhodopila sp.]
MSQTTATAGSIPKPSRERPPAALIGPWAWMRTNLFGSWWSTAVTLALGYIIVRIVYALVMWGVVNAIWTVPYTPTGTANTAACQMAQGVGACWAIITDKYRLVLFGRYPYEEQWRPAVVVLLFIGLYVVSGMRRFWRKELILIWIVTLTVIGVLMWGGILGLTPVPEDSWGGLPITLILATFGAAFSFPLAILVALGRRSTRLPAVKFLCVLYVELIRGVPLISVLFMASVMFPLFMPEGITVNKLLRAQIAFILFAGAYLAEVVRGGLQALPKGQAEAADALGLGYWQKTSLIILPQALRLVIPPLVNTFIGFFKDTSLVLIIGIFDLLTMGKVALSDPPWQSFSTEMYISLAVIYIAFCFAMSKYSRNLERDLNRAKAR